ncbi:MAG: hypothetical protein ABIZ80_14855, partial [Bryobacteraceae bacterium]
MVFANGSTSYQNLELKVGRRPGPAGLSGVVAFTWAKAIEDYLCLRGQGPAVRPEILFPALSRRWKGDDSI